MHSWSVSTNTNKSIAPTYAVPDATAFAKALKSVASPLFDKIDIQLLTTPALTTKENITRAFEGLRTQIKPNDLFVFFNASHGTVDVVNGINSLLDRPQLLEQSLDIHDIPVLGQLAVLKPKDVNRIEGVFLS